MIVAVQLISCGSYIKINALNRYIWNILLYVCIYIKGMAGKYDFFHHEFLQPHGIRYGFMLKFILQHEIV